MVAREGRFMRGRLASGILRRIGLSELVASSENEYVDIAVRLAEDVEYRQRIRQFVTESRHVLFDDMDSINALEEFLIDVAKPC
jgi:predicted O-linked N-acetylglucosamine transferase (SPINDLY family)